MSRKKPTEDQIKTSCAYNYLVNDDTARSTLEGLLGDPSKKNEFVTTAEQIIQENVPDCYYPGIGQDLWKLGRAQLDIQSGQSTMAAMWFI